MQKHVPTLQLSLIRQLRREYEQLSLKLTERSKADFGQIFVVEKRLKSLMKTKTLEKNEHEYMNLLSALRGYAEILLEELPSSYRSTLEISRKIISSIETTNVQQTEKNFTYPDKFSSSRLSHDISFISDSNEEKSQILIVDDMEENLDLMTRQLEKNVHRVITASNGMDALALLSNSEIDVVLLDLLMPEMNGREVLQRIKEDTDLRATSVIMISGQQDIDDIIKCIEAGADDYLLKPFNPVLLKARIKAGIDRKRWHDKEEKYRKQLERSHKFIRATFGRYLSDDIVSEILEGPDGLELGGDLREVTILMSDIRGFTKLSEGLAPAKVVKILNRYLGIMSDIVMEYDGTIDEFLGDAILAVFGAPQSRSNDTDRAVKCAIKMQLAMNDINASNVKDGLPTIKTGIAVNTGSVIAGNIGSERRSKYGFVGTPMNITSRIEDKTRGGEILISDSTKQKLQDQYFISTSKELKVKSLKTPLLVHSISATKQKLST